MISKFAILAVGRRCAEIHGLDNDEFGGVYGRDFGSLMATSHPSLPWAADASLRRR
jgi:hypothetical protein